MNESPPALRDTFKRRVFDECVKTTMPDAAPLSALKAQALLRRALHRPGRLIGRTGDVDRAFAVAAAVCETEYVTAHPAGSIRIRAALDAAGAPLGIFARMAGSSRCAFEIPYDIPNLWVEQVPNATPGYAHEHACDASVEIFARECFIDEVARTAGADPVAYRLARLRSSPARQAALARAAAEAGWGARAGVFHGAALHADAGGCAAVVAGLARGSGDALRLEHIVCTIDSREPLDPAALAASLPAAIAFVRETAPGAAAVLRALHAAPRIDICRAERAAGSPGAGAADAARAFAPALANAVATGVRARAEGTAAP